MEYNGISLGLAYHLFTLHLFLCSRHSSNLHHPSSTRHSSFIFLLDPFIPHLAIPAGCHHAPSPFTASLHSFRLSRRLFHALPNLPSIDLAVHDMSQWLTATNWLNPTPGGLWVFGWSGYSCPIVQQLTPWPLGVAKRGRDSDTKTGTAAYIYIQDTFCFH